MYCLPSQKGKMSLVFHGIQGTFASFWLFNKNVYHWFHFLGSPEAESFLATAPSFC